jgi:hypothetical protein
MKQLLAFLLLCAVASADGPLFSIWHIDGHGYQWQQDRQADGLPMEASIRIPHYVQLASVFRLQELELNAPVLSSFSGQPVQVRFHNLGGAIADARVIPRIRPLTAETFRQSHVCVRVLPDGLLDDTPMPCPFAGPAAWSQFGQMLATAPWTTRLQQIVENPAGVIFRENNESPTVTFNQLWRKSVVYKRNSTGKLVPVTLTDSPSVYADPVGPEWHYYTEQTINGPKVRAASWQLDAALDLIDLRAKEWVAPRRPGNPLDPRQAADFDALVREQYRAFYDTFDANLSPGWSGKLRTVGYGNWSETKPHDTASPPLYLAYWTPDVLTDPGYLTTKLDWFNEQIGRQPQAWREWSVGCYPKSIYTGLQLGVHDAVDPASFAGFMLHAAWRNLQSPGVEARMTYWDNYNTLPTQLMLTGSHVTAVQALGREDLLSLTIHDYEVAVMQQMARIHQHPVLNRYWREGTTTVLDSPQNDAATVRVYATETKIEGVQQTLLCVYTPCGLTGEIQVGEWTVPAKRFAYYLTGAVREIE